MMKQKLNKADALRRMIYTALMVAMGVVLPLAFHAIPNAGSIFLPMHIPVLICGLLCGAPYGLVCGILTPLMSHWISGMPPLPYLPSMLCELAAYGLLAGVLMFLLRKQNRYMGVYLSLAGAMICGRIVWGLLNALIFRAGAYTLEIWMTGAFVTALPGLIIQIIVIPALIFALRAARLAPQMVAEK